MKARYIGHKISNIFSVDEIITVHYLELGKDFNSRGESHNFWEFVYIDKGKMCVTADEKTYTLSQGDGIFHKPNEYHIHYSNHISAPNIFIISFVCKSKNMEFFQDRVLHISDKIRPLIGQILSEAEKTYEMSFNNMYTKEMKFKGEAIIGGQQMIRTFLEQFLVYIFRNEGVVNDYIFPTKETMEEHIAEKIAQYIKENIYTKKTTVADICGYLGYSRAYLSRIFKDNYNLTITEYMSKVRIDEAKRLIREEKLNFTQISDMLLFSNPFYFSRIFRKIAGMSPSEYSNSVKRD